MVVIDGRENPHHAVMVTRSIRSVELGSSCDRSLSFFRAIQERHWCSTMPSAKTETFLVRLIASLAAAAVLILVIGTRRQHLEQSHSRQFQKLVRGLGFGPALDLSKCEFSFDPRLNPFCSWDCRPTPAGIDFCPIHASSILRYQTGEDHLQNLP